jgi:hypothetical protein
MCLHVHGSIYHTTLCCVYALGALACYLSLQCAILVCPSRHPTCSYFMITIYPSCQSVMFSIFHMSALSLRHHPPTPSALFWDGAMSYTAAHIVCGPNSILQAKKGGVLWTSDYNLTLRDSDLHVRAVAFVYHHISHRSNTCLVSCALDTDACYGFTFRPCNPPNMPIPSTGWACLCATM